MVFSAKMSAIRAGIATSRYKTAASAQRTPPRPAKRNITGTVFSGRFMGVIGLAGIIRLSGVAGQTGGTVKGIRGGIGHSTAEGWIGRGKIVCGIEIKIVIVAHVGF